MKLKITNLLFLLFAAVLTIQAQSSWLDRPLGNNWNNLTGVLPTAPRNTPIGPACREQVRPPESIADRAVTRAGWSLFGPSQTWGSTTVITAMAGVDGMCRPMGYNAFVFVNSRFAGTLAPAQMDSRTDGSLTTARLINSTQVLAEFSRYTSTDPLCCPSQTSVVRYSLGQGARALVVAENVDTKSACTDGGEVTTQDNVITGTVRYRERAALPQGAVLTVRLVDVSRQDVSSVPIAEQRIELRGRQAPIDFDLVYPPKSIEERNRYAVRAEITDGTRLLYTTDRIVPVLTQGNPRTVELDLVRVGGGVGRGSGTIRGTVSYRERIALPAGAQARVWLVDAADENGPVIAETSVTLNRQVPANFELTYEPRDISRQRSYVLRAELSSGGEVRFATENPVPVDLRGSSPITGVDLVLVAVNRLPDAITGQTLNLSRFGAGFVQIEGRGSELLVRVEASVRPDGTANVNLYRIMGLLPFTGRLTTFEQNRLRITVTASGEADASGEIEIRYSGRNIQSISSTNLVLDGQNVSVRL